MADLFGQGDFEVRLDWGPVGAYAARADVSVVVDVFSFSTSVCQPYPRLVMPSPNGSTIATALLETGATVAVGCFRNAGAAGKWLAASVERGRSCVGGKELSSKGFAADVEAAADLNASTVIPILVDGSFGPAAWSQPWRAALIGRGPARYATSAMACANCAW